MSRYRKTMVDALKEVNEIGTDQYRKYLEKLTPGQGKSLDENNMALMKKAAGGAMQTLKMKDGKLKMDSFTASAIMAIYKAVNPKNKKTMENLINTGNKAAMMKLQKFAMSKINSGDELEHDGDELQEHKGTKPHPHPHKEKDEAVDPADVDDDATDDDIKAADKNIMMQMRKVISLRGNFKVEFGDKKKVKIDPKIAQAVQKKYDSMRKPMDKEKFQAKVSKSYKDMLSALKESLDEKRDMSAPPVSAKVVEDDGFRLVMKFKDGTTEALPSLGKPSMQNLKRIVDKNILKNPKRKAWVSVVSAAMKKGPVKEPAYGRKYQSEAKLDEEVELDEKKEKPPVFKGTPAEIKKQMKAWKKKHDKIGIGEGFPNGDGPDVPAMEVGTDRYQDYVKELTPGESVEEGSAAADARRAIGRDKDLGRRKDSADDDDSATDDDVKAASKNIIMQMRKVVSLKGNFKVEFGNGKKEKIDVKVAQAVQSKYNSIKRPQEKQKFQAKVAKSKKDLLNALKESLEEGKMGQIDALIKQGKSAKEIAKAMKVDVKTINKLMSSYNKEERTLFKINSKIKEIKNG